MTLDAATVTVNPTQAVITDSLGETFSIFGVRVTVDVPWAPQTAPRPSGAPGSLKSVGRPIVFVFPHSIDRAQLRRGLTMAISKMLAVQAPRPPTILWLMNSSKLPEQIANRVDRELDRLKV